MIAHGNPRPSFGGGSTMLCFPKRTLRDTGGKQRCGQSTWYLSPYRMDNRTRRGNAVNLLPQYYCCRYSCCSNCYISNSVPVDSRAEVCFSFLPQSRLPVDSRCELLEVHRRLYAPILKSVYCVRAVLWSRVACAAIPQK